MSFILSKLLDDSITLILIEIHIDHSIKFKQPRSNLLRIHKIVRSN